MIKKLINKLFHRKKHTPLNQYWLDVWNKDGRVDRKKISEEFKEIEDKMLSDKREIKDYYPNKG